jgi:hypothetical protein
MTIAEQTNDPLCYCKHLKTEHEDGNGRCNKCLCDRYWILKKQEAEVKTEAVKPAGSIAGHVVTGPQVYIPRTYS